MKSVPVVEQVFVTAPADTHKFAFELKLFKARRRAEKLLAAEGDDEFYVTHLSCRVLVYKGLVMPEYLASCDPDLADPQLESSFCVFHPRFSTNPPPQWRLCYPCRHLAPNGAIHTTSGTPQWPLSLCQQFS